MLIVYTGNIFSRLMMDPNTKELMLGSRIRMINEEELQGDALSMEIYVVIYNRGVVVMERWGEVQAYLGVEKIIPNVLCVINETVKPWDAGRILFRNSGNMNVYHSGEWMYSGTLYYDDPPLAT